MLRLRQGLVLLGLAVLVAVAVIVFPDRGDAFAKKKGGPIDPVPVGGGSASGHSSVKISEDSNLRRILNVGRDCLNDKDWPQAIEAFQKLLEQPKDHYVQVTEKDPTGQEVKRWTSVKFEANNLIGSMPLEGLLIYEQKHGADAKTKLDEAKKKGDRESLAEVAQIFCHTHAGIEANEILATLFLQRGQIFTAALRYEKLLQMNPERTKLSDLTLFKASLAFYRAGDKKNYEETWKRFSDNLQGKVGLKLGEDVIPVAKLDAAIKDATFVDPVNVHDWPSWRGNARNSAQASGSPPLLDSKLFSRKIFMDKPYEGAADDDPDQASLDRVQRAIKQVADANRAVLPGFFPIASNGVMVYRSQRDVRAVALRPIELRDEDGSISKFQPGQIVWRSIPHDRSLAILLEKPALRAKIEQWMQSYDGVPGFNSLLYENTVVGTLATDHRFVYAINDLAVPPHPGVFMQNQFNPQFNQYNPGEIKPYIVQNELVAYDLMNGKMKWDLNQNDPMFRDSHFLSLPISVGGKLYVLNEKMLETTGGAAPPFGGGIINPFPGESELRLVCIDPTKITQTATSPKPTIVGDPQPLGTIVQHNRMVQDIGRRVNAVQLGYDEGILVCPTNAGEVFGIDLMTRGLVWSYPYRDQGHAQVWLPGMQFQPGFPGMPKMNTTTTVYSKWKSSPPAIQDGKVVFTAPDADSIHCISLRDGKPLWKKAQQKGDLYMAGVYRGRVLIVNDTTIRALDLKTGGQLWTIYTGDLPSGQGVASKDIYYLPLKKGEILAVDVVKGEVKAHNRAAAGSSAPGNLVFYENMVLTQTPTEVVAYPQLSARLADAALASKQSPDDLFKLTDYGELLLKDGQVQAAVDVLHKAYNNRPQEQALNKRVRERLFEALTDLMHIDFAKADKDYLDTYKALCSVPDNNLEEQRRKSKFHRLVGQGREAQGNLVEAFKNYKEFGALPIHKDEGISSAEDPNYKIPVNMWLRGRISGMLSKATDEQKAPLEAAIAKEWADVEATKDINAFRSFVGMFDVPVRVGREARIRLAETIMDRDERTSFLEAEMLLNQVMGGEYRSDPNTGGRALAALAQLEEKKRTNDSMRLAAAYYRELKDHYGDKIVRGKKTGADLFNELATDKRFLPFLEESSGGFNAPKLAAREIGAGAFVVGMPGFAMTPDGDQTPFAKQNRLILDPSDTFNPRIRLRDQLTNQDRWVTNLGRVDMNQQLFFNLYQQSQVNQPYFPNARFRFYQLKGHLIVCQVGVMVYCIDGDTGKKLWEMMTVENIPQNGFVHLQQVTNDVEGNPEFIYWNQQTNQRFTVQLGRIGTAQASYVAVIGHKGMHVVDPLRGTVLWKRPDVSVNSHIFGDDQYLFLAEANAPGNFGVGRTIRATDGEVLAIADFSAAYQARIRTIGRHILAANYGDGVTLRLYDIIAGKDKWAKKFPAGSHVLKTEDANIVGVLDNVGKLTVLDTSTGKELLETSVTQGRITVADLQTLRDPLLLQDSERFYVALNRPIEMNKVDRGLLHNNFNNGTRCLPINGWFLAVQRADGKKQVGDREVAWKKGDLAWHSYMPVTNQMIVLDQFEHSPVILFTVRYNEIMNNGGNRWVSVTQSLHKSNGKMVYDSGPRQINGASPMFSLLQLDLKARTVNLIGFSGSVQHYVDDGKGPPPQPGAMLNPGNPPAFGMGGPVAPGQPFGGIPAGAGGPIFPGVMPPPMGQLPPQIRLRIVDEVEVIPAIELPPIRKR